MLWEDIYTCRRCIVFTVYLLQVRNSNGQQKYSNLLKFQYFKTWEWGIFLFSIYLLPSCSSSHYCCNGMSLVVIIFLPHRCFIIGFNFFLTYYTWYNMCVPNFDKQMTVWDFYNISRRQKFELKTSRTFAFPLIKTFVRYNEKDIMDN